MLLDERGRKVRLALVSEAAGNSYVERPPPAALADVVASMWVQQVALDGDPYIQRNLPSGSVELRCRVGYLPQVGGPLTRSETELLAPGTTIVGLRFWPAAGSRVLPLPVSELTDQVVGADELWGVAGAALGEMVDAAATAGDALGGLVRHLVRVLDPAPPDPLVCAAVQRLHWRSEDVSLLTRTLHISERQLRRRIQAVVGLPPKALHRTLRFQDFLALAQHAIAQGRAPTEEGLARLAADAGYADQAHLNRECARLTGLTPGAFLGQAERTCACGHDHAAAFVPLLRSRPRASTDTALR
jgi:AraC-like DNA-binding protein